MKNSNGISKLLFMAVSIATISTVSDLQAADAARVAKVSLLEAKTEQLLAAIKGYKDCTFRGVCTQAQRSNLRNLGKAVGAAVLALVTGFITRKVTQRGMEQEFKEREGEIERGVQQREKQLELTHEAQEEVVKDFQKMQMEYGAKDRGLKQKVKGLEAQLQSGSQAGAQ